MMVHNIQKPLSLIDTDHGAPYLPVLSQSECNIYRLQWWGSQLNGNYSLQGGARLMTELSFYIVYTGRGPRPKAICFVSAVGATQQVAGTHHLLKVQGPRCWPVVCCVAIMRAGLRTCRMEKFKCTVCFELVLTKKWPSILRPPQKRFGKL